MGHQPNAESEAEGDQPRIRTEVIDPSSAPNKFVALYLDGEERAMIPWREAEAIAETVDNDEGGN